MTLVLAVRERNTSIAMENKTSFKVQLEKFSGPLDLLLELIEERNLEITEIALSEVTAGYLNYLSQIKEVRPQDLGDFLVVAATLILIKSKALLPVLELSSEEKEEIFNLESRLMIYQWFKEKAPQLNELLKSPVFLFSRPEMVIEPKFSPPSHLKAEELFKAYQRVLNSFLTENEVLPQGKIKRVISLEERIKDLITKLAGGQEFKFTEIVNQNDKEDIIVTFLAILHLIKEKIIEVEQKDIFGELIIKTKQNEQSK